MGYKLPKCGRIYVLCKQIRIEGFVLRMFRRMGKSAAQTCMTTKVYDYVERLSSGLTEILTSISNLTSLYYYGT